MKIIYIINVFLIMIVGSIHGESSIDENELIHRMVTQYNEMWKDIERVEYDAELLEGSLDDSGILKVKDRFIKRVIVTVLPDTTLFEEKYIEYYKDGELQDDDELREEAEKKIERREKSGSRGISWPLLTPFFPDQKEYYKITYGGISDSLINGYICYVFHVSSLEEHDQRINGTYFIEKESLQPVRLDFSPSKLGGGTMFKLKQLDMTVWSEPAEDGLWLPTRFDIAGKGRAALLVGVSFAGREYYTNPRVRRRVATQDPNLLSGIEDLSVRD